MSDGALLPYGQLLILGGLGIVGAILYATIRAMRAVYIQQGRRFSRCRLTGREAARRLLEYLGLPTDRIDDGAKIDHYDIWRRRVRLRTESSVSSTVAALAIAAHEVGHAAQFATGYWAARATRCLLVLLMLGGTVLFVYPFVAIIAGDGDVNLTRLTAWLVIFPMLRLPVTLALESDASRRAVRLLNETRLADASEHVGIDRLLAACFRTHLAFSVGLIFLVSACVGAMSLVENSLDMPLRHQLQAALSGKFDPSMPQPALIPIDLDEPVMGNPLTLSVVAFSLGVAWWAMRGSTKKTPARSAIDANNEGMARFLAGDPAGAIVMIDEALRLDPRLATAHYNRAVVLCSQGHGNVALASLEAMFACRQEELEPYLGIPDVWFLRGTLRLDQGEYLAAIDDLSRALTLEPEEPAVLLRNRGLAWIRLGQLDRALEDTNAALALQPEDAVAYNNRGVIFRDQGNLEQAEADLRRALAIEPELPIPREHLATLLELKREIQSLV